MSPKYLKEYKIIEENVEKRVGETGFAPNNLNAFYNGVRRSSNILEQAGSPKIDWIINKIKMSNRPTLVFSHFLNSGNKVIEKRLVAAGVPIGVINGSTPKKERQEMVNKINKGTIRALLISKAGAEGLDLKGIRDVILLEPGWNETTVNQVVGRARRYKSHSHLPANEQYVDVWQLYLLKNANEMNTFEDKIWDPELREKIKNSGWFAVDLMLQNFSNIKEGKLKKFDKALRTAETLEQCFYRNKN